MNVIYTRHARQRMAQRKISEAQIRETLELPDEIVPGDQQEEIAIRKYGTREVRVVYTQLETDVYLVFTAISARVRDRNG